MKKIIILLIFSFLLFAGCKKEKCGDGCYTFGAGYIKYEATIGYDFDSALDSLLLVVPYDQIFHNEPYYIDPELMDRVNYPANDRSFYMITVKDSTNGLYLGSSRDAIDSKGCWYTIIWGED